MIKQLSINYTIDKIANYSIPTNKTSNANIQQTVINTISNTHDAIITYESLHLLLHHQHHQLQQLQHQHSVLTRLAVSTRLAVFSHLAV